MTNKTFKITGMHCTSCSAIITKKVSKLDGVKNINVNYASEKANIDFDESKINIEQMNNEIEKLGYSIHENKMDNMPGMDHSEHLDLKQSKTDKEKNLSDQRSKILFVFPLAIIIFLIMMWDIASQTLPFLTKFPIPMEIFNTIAMILSTIVMFWIGKPFIRGVIRFIKYRVANMDTLIGIGTLTAYIYSVTITLFPQIREIISLPEYTYFDVVIVVIGFVALGKYLESRSKQRTGEAIEKLLELQAKTALVVRR
jgi:Cu+-exporting ATPase